MAYQPTTVVTTRHGLMKVFRDDKWVSRSLSTLGEYSEGELEFLSGVISKRASQVGRALTIVEAGAYIGDMTIPLSRMVRHVHAFEPNPASRELLWWNLKNNHCHNVTVWPFGLSNSQGQATFHFSDPDNPGSAMYSSEAGDCELRTLDSVLKGGVVDLIKGDVEGMEVPLLAGAIQTLTDYKPILFMEADTVVTPGVESIDSVMQQMGYEVSKWGFPLWRVENWSGCTQDPWGGNFVSFMSLGMPPVDQG